MCLSSDRWETGQSRRTKSERTQGEPVLTWQQPGTEGQRVGAGREHGEILVARRLRTVKQKSSTTSCVADLPILSRMKMTSRAAERVSRRYLRRFTKTARTGAASADVETFVRGFMQRHPSLRARAPQRVKSIEHPGAGPHGEARQHGDEIWLFPKFWELDAKTKDWVFAHEIGHYVLSRYGLAKMIDLASKLGIDPWDASSLPYGQHNMEEAFAECFAARMQAHAELVRRDPKWSALVDHVFGGRLAADVLQFRPKPRGPTINIRGRVYVKSTYGGPLGDALDHDDARVPGGARLIKMKPHDPWKFLWVFDTDRKMVAMWRISDGSEKVFGPASSLTHEIVMLESRGQLNRVTHSEFGQVSGFMLSQENEAIASMQRYIAEHATEEEKKLPPLVLEYFRKTVVPEFTQRMHRWESGAHPLGFKLLPNSALGPKRQLASWTMYEVMKSLWTLDKVEAFLKARGINLSVLGNQDVDFVMKDVWYEAGDDVMSVYHDDPPRRRS
jgi:hypothetical protein